MTNERFREIRHWLGMSQIEFAEYLGVADSTVFGIEANDRRVSENVASIVAKKFEVTPEFVQFVENRKRLSL